MVLTNTLYQSVPIPPLSLPTQRVIKLHIGKTLTVSTDWITRLHGSFQHLRLQQNGRSVTHHTDHLGSAVYVLSGEIRAQFGEDLAQSIDAVQGDLLYLAPNQSLSLSNFGANAEVLILSTQPSIHD